MLEPTRDENVLDIVLNSQKEFVSHWGCSDHNQIYFIIKGNGERNKKYGTGNIFTKEDIRI